MSAKTEKPKVSTVKEIPDGAKVIIQGPIFDSYGSGEIRHRFSRSKQYLHSYLKTGESNIIIPGDAYAELIELAEFSDDDTEYFISWE